MTEPISFQWRFKVCIAVTYFGLEYCTVRREKNKRRIPRRKCTFIYDIFSVAFIFYRVGGRVNSYIVIYWELKWRLWGYDYLSLTGCSG